MALGVLNNLSAIYAENNLNNTNNSLQTVLQQLSSGSKINSGADDAAGLSLVNGLEANQTALKQAQTNATEGVGLLQVADGALSQVTSLLDRAITLATEASNGTLNSTQEGAANQEYQSILSEVNNIGQTTTYNQEQVFNSQEVAIYTGDSSAAGSSIDALNIRALSESSVGDTGGLMAYSSGSNSVFINLSTSQKNAQATDTLNISGTTMIDVNYLVKGSNGTESSASTTITVGIGSSFPNTANGLISAINSAGLGLSASFATQSQAGVAGGGAQTGIQITGGLISAGIDPSTASTSGTLNLTGTAANALLTPGQSVIVQSGTTAAVTVAVSSTVATLEELAGAINGQATAITASVITNSNGTDSLSLSDKLGGGPLTVSTAQSSYIPTISSSDVLSVDNPVSMSFVARPADTGTAGTEAKATLGITGITNDSSAALNGTLILSNTLSGGPSSLITITMNSNVAGDSTHINIGTSNSNLSGLAGVLNGTITPAGDAGAVGTLGISAAVTSSGLTLTSNTTGTTISGVSSGLTATPLLGLTGVVNGAPSNPGSAGTTVLEMNTGTGPGLNLSDTLTPWAAGTGTVVVTNSSLDTPGNAVSFVVGAGTNNTTTFYTQNDTVHAGANTVQDLVDIMGTGLGAAAAGLSSATLSGPGGNILLTSANVGTTINVTSNVQDTFAITNGATVPGTPQNLVGSTSQNASFTMAASVTPDLDSDPMTTTGDTLAGSIVLSNGTPGTAVTFQMGNGGAQTVSGQVITLSGAESNLTGLMNVINNASGSGNIAAGTALVTGLGITAAINATDTGLNFSTATTGTIIGVTATGLTDASTFEFTNPVQGGVGVLATGTVALVDGGKIATAGALTGSITVHNGAVTDIFKMGAGANTLAGNNNTIFTGANTLGSLITAISNEGGSTSNLGNTLGLTAVQDPTTGGILLQGSVDGDTGLLASNIALSMSMNEVGNTGSGGAAVVPANIGATVLYGTGTNNQTSDTVTGNLVIKNTGGTNATTTFVMNGAVDQAHETSTLGATTVNVFGTTLGALANAINADSTTTYGAFSGTSGVDLSATVNGSGLTVQARDTNGSLGVLSGQAASTLKDVYGTESLTPNPGTAASGATYASAVLGTAGTIGLGDVLSGAIVLNNGGGAGGNYTFTMGTNSALSAGKSIVTAGTSITDLANAISNSGIGISATVNSSTHELQLQSTNVDTTIIVSGTPTLKDTATETFTAGSPDPGVLEAKSTARVNLVNPSNPTVPLTTAEPGDILTGSITLTGTNGTEVFTMGGSSSLGTIAVGSTSSDETLQNLASSITNSGIGITAAADGSGLALTMGSYGNTAITGSSALYDTLGYAASYATLGSFSSESDTLAAGTISFTVGGNPVTEPVSKGETVSALIADIKANSATLGVTANWVATGNNGYGNVVLTSNNYGTAGNITNASSNVADTITGAALNYTPAGAYNIGISNYSSFANALYDSSTQSNPYGTDTTEFIGNSGGSNKTATISYSDGAGESLSGTDLTNQSDAEVALNDLNIAISDVAAQDGYIGAQINTLNSISQVMSTQQENVVSAQNAIQATDYASATANMSKYEILSQTGIAALAQANSVQQEVTKLLQ